MNQQSAAAVLPNDLFDADESPELFYRQAHLMALCSLHVYPPSKQPNENDQAVVTRLTDLFADWGLDWDRLEYLSNGSTQCFIAGNADVIVVCYRGTEMTLWDIVQDVFAIQTKDPGIEGRAHFGFINGVAQSWDSSYGLPEGTGLVAALAKHRTTQKVWFTGHSLGGAISEVAAARLIHENVLSAADVAGIVTFGQPRAGNGEFARAYDDTYGLKERHVRFVNNMDGVTLVPPPFRVSKVPSYRHVGRVAFIDRGQKIHAYVGFCRLVVSRLGSWIQGLFRGPLPHEERVGFLSRIFPFGSDHSMLGYEGALAKKVGKP